MEYIFTDSPMITKRIDRRSSKLKRIQQERAEERSLKFQEIMSVQDLIKMGFYESKNNTMPFGIEVFTRTCTLKDKNHEWYEREVPTLALCLPKKEYFSEIEKLNPAFWENSLTHYWGFKTSAIPALWAITHLLERLINLSAWESFYPIPICWKLGNDRAMKVAKSTVEKINQSIPLNYEIPPQMKIIEKTALLELYQKHNSHSGSITSFLRHEYTPYDYLWQTGVLNRDQARSILNSNIKKLYPYLYA